MFYNALCPFILSENVSSNSLIKGSYSDLEDKEIKLLSIAYPKYCCIFMAQLKSVGEN